MKPGETIAIGRACLDTLFQADGPLVDHLVEVSRRAGQLHDRKPAGNDEPAPSADDLAEIYTPAFRRRLHDSIGLRKRSLVHLDLASMLGLDIAQQALAADYPPTECPVGRSLFEAVRAKHQAECQAS